MNAALASFSESFFWDFSDLFLADLEFGFLGYQTNGQATLEKPSSISELPNANFGKLFVVLIDGHKGLSWEVFC